jgi:hypothetical protein
MENGDVPNVQRRRKKNLTFFLRAFFFFEKYGLPPVANTKPCQLPCTACSPDLHPIENVWALMKDAVQHRRIRPRNAGEMVAALNEEWGNVREEFLTRLYESLPERIQAVIDEHGGHTRW